MKILSFFVSLGLTTLVLANPVTANSHVEALQKAGLNQFTQNLHQSQYKRLAAKAQQLANSVAKLKLSDLSAVEKARQDWRDARQPWEISEAGLFGPVDSEGHDPNLDSWPLDVNEINQLLKSPKVETLNSALIQSLDEGMKGFHAIEFLLFADSEGKPIPAKQTLEQWQKQPRQLEYLKACAQAFLEESKALHAAYTSSTAWYTQFTLSPADPEVYPSTKAALLEVANALVAILDESANEKLGVPTTENSTQNLESRFSGNTLEDVRNNVQGIILGFESAFSAWLKPNHAALYEEIHQAVKSYQVAVSHIPASFNEQPGSAAKEVTQAIAAADQAKTLLEKKLLPLLQ